MDQSKKRVMNSLRKRVTVQLRTLDQKSTSVAPAQKVMPLNSIVASSLKSRVLIMMVCVVQPMDLNVRLARLRKVLPAVNNLLIRKVRPRRKKKI